MSKRLFFSGAKVLAILVMLGAAFTSNHGTVFASGTGRTTLAHLTMVGSTVIGHGNTNASTNANIAGKYDQVRTEKELNPQVPSPKASILPPPPTMNPNPAGRGVTTSNAGETGFNGLTHADQRNAGTGIYVNTQFSLEPPDQGLCVGHNAVLEAVNNALAVYSTKGTLLAGPTALSQFFGLAPEINRTTNVAGPFISDPKCLYDGHTGRWFLTELEQDTGKNPGATGRQFQLIAVSQTGNPTGLWTLFKFDTTDDGLHGTPQHANCPCFGDQPLIGTDDTGFYVSTNEFGLTAGFNGAQIYAVSKTMLAAAASHTGSLPAIVHIDAGQQLVPYGGLSYSVQPAVRSPGDWNRTDEQNQDAHQGIEYFLSSLQFGNPGYTVLDNRIAVWGLTNTRSLNGTIPNLTLFVKVIGSETYGQPNDMTQKPGPTPLATSLGDPLEKLQSNDDRMNQVVFAQDNLWGAVNTIVGNGTRTGIAYFKVQPSWNLGVLQAHMQAQGYVAVDGNNVAYPSVAVTPDGRGIIAFTLVGPHYYPSAAYIRVNGDGAFGKIHIAAAGAGPDDGFTGYKQFGGNGAGRWGDYSAALASPDGTVWSATEYIPNAPRTQLANWGTFISHVVTGDNN